MPILKGVAVLAVVVSDKLFLEVSDYTWASIVVAGIVCLALTISIKATQSWLIPVLLFVNAAILFVTAGMWLPSTFNVGIICGFGFWLWIFIAFVMMVISVVRMIKTRKRAL